MVVPEAKYAAYGIVRGFLGGLLESMGFAVSDIMIDIIAYAIGYFGRGRLPEYWLDVLRVGAVVSIGIEVGEGIGKRIASEVGGAFRGVAKRAMEAAAPAKPAAPAPTTGAPRTITIPVRW